MVAQLLLGCVLFAGAAATQTPISKEEWLNRGTQALQSSKYPDAVDAFQHAVDLSPSDFNAHIGLATAYISQWIPGAESPENEELGRRARAEFESALAIKPDDLASMQSLASLTFNEAMPARDPVVRARKLEEAAEWHSKVLSVDPRNREAYYNLGVIAWARFYPELMQARARLGMRPEDPGPLPDFNVRQDLRNRMESIVEKGIENLQKALELDPAYDDAMAYMNLLVRERADLRDRPEEYKTDVAAADAWVQKALDTKRMKAQSGVGGGLAKGSVIGGIIRSDAPPPPAPGTQRIRMNAVPSSALIQKVDPAYPALARQARIQGTVRFTAVIGKDGKIQNLQLVSGHPLLVQAATEAVRQWVYRPTLLNGEPMEVVTQIDLPFTLTQ